MRQLPVNRNSSPEVLSWSGPAFPVGAALLLVGSFLYVWLRMEPLLEYHRYGPYFYQHRLFLETFLDRPGGLASYAGVFLAQLNSLSWLGALTFVLLQCSVLLLTLICLARVSGRTPGFLSLVPLFLLLLLRNRYNCPVPALSVGLLLALGASAAHLWFPWRRPWLFAAVSGFVSVLLFALAGLWSAWLFGILASLFVVARMRNRPVGLVCLVLALAAPLLAVAAWNLEWAGLINPWPTGAVCTLAAILYAFVPIAGAVLAFLPMPASTPSRWLQTAWLGRALTALTFLLGAAAVWFTFDPRQKLLAEMDYHTGCAQYESVLAAASQLKVLNDPAKIRLQLALYHTGRLAEDLFSFRPMFDTAPSEGIGEDCRAQSQPLFELGLINDAEHMAYEALVMEGDRPDLLRLLARINLLKDQPRAAQVFLNLLSLIPFQDQRANDSWPRIEPQLPTAEQALLTQMRAGILTNDVLHDGLPVGRLLEVLLASHPTNQMAFEYLMANYLLDRDLKSAIEHLPLLDTFQYPRLPRTYEEALLLFQELQRVQVDLKGRTIRPETVERFRQFKTAVRQLKGKADGRAVMAATFGDTYWFYYATRSPARPAETQAATP